jgi:Na+/proline symporter
LDAERRPGVYGGADGDRPARVPCGPEHDGPTASPGAALHPLDLAIISAFVIASLTAGLRARRRASRDLEEYFLAGRTLRGWQAGFSMAATQFAADTPLVVTGLVATTGLFGLWQLWSYGLAFLLLGFLFAPLWRRAGVLTDAELAEARYSGRGAIALRGVRAVLYGVVFNTVVLAMVLLAATLFAAPFLLWNEWLPGWIFEPLVSLAGNLGAEEPLRAVNDTISLGLVVLFALTYSTTGGLRGVVFTDVLQFSIMMLGTAAYAFLAVRAAGGPGAIASQVAEMGSQRVYDLGPEPGAAGLVAVFALQWMLQRNADGTGYLAQRAMACRSDADARRAAVWFAFLQVGLRSWLWVPLALALLVLFPPAPDLAADLFTRDREATFVLGIRALLPVGLLGLMMTGMLAALASTLDTHLNWGASYLSNDLYARLWCRGVRGREPSSRSQVWVARLSAVLLVVLAAMLVPRLGSIQAAWKATLVLGAGIGAVTVLRWLWWRITAWGELAALAASFGFAPLALALLSSEVAQMLGGAAVGTLAAVTVSLLGPQTDPEVLERFARKVRPPGFWGPWGDGAGRAELGRALLATLAAGTSLFAVLIAGLRILAPGPDGAGLAATLGLAALALAALPGWLPVLRRR